MSQSHCAVRCLGLVGAASLKWGASCCLWPDMKSCLVGIFRTGGHGAIILTRATKLDTVGRSKEGFVLRLDMMQAAMPQALATSVAYVLPMEMQRGLLWAATGMPRWDDPNTDAWRRAMPTSASRYLHLKTNSCLFLGPGSNNT